MMSFVCSSRRLWTLFGIGLLAVLAGAGVNAATTGKVIIIQ